MASVKLLFTLFVVVLVRAELTPEAPQNLLEQYHDEISAVLNHLNAQHPDVYSYKLATLQYAHKKADVIELNVDVFVQCIEKYPRLPCTEETLSCTAYVQSGQSRVLSSVPCYRKAEVVEKAIATAAPVRENHEKTVSAETDGHFVAVLPQSAPCPGCPFELNTNADGVDELVDIAIRHVETERDYKHFPLKVLKLQQQVVSGVKYILLLEIYPTLCRKEQNVDQQSCPIDPKQSTIVCQISFLQKPWINRAKHVIQNNCTVSQEYAISDRSDANNEINVNGGRFKPDSGNKHTDFDKIAETGAVDEMTPSRLDDLEAQIIVDEFTPVSVVPSSTVSSTISGLSDLEAQILLEEVIPSTSNSDVFASSPSMMVVKEPLEDRPSNIYNTEDSGNVDSYASTITASTEELESLVPTTQTTTSEEILVEGNARPKRAIRQLEKISSEEKPLVKNLADYVAAAMDSIDEDHHRRVVLQILGAKKMVGDDGIYYHLILRMGISRCLEDKAHDPAINCREKLLENYTKICKVQVHVNEEYSSPKIVKSQCQNIKKDKNHSNRTNYSRFKRGLPGNYVQYELSLNDDKIINFMDNVLVQLDKESAHGNKYKSKVISAIRQVIAGSVYRIKTNILISDCAKSVAKKGNDCGVLKNSTSKLCNIEVWERAWQHTLDYSIYCEDEDEVKFEVSQKRRKRETKLGGWQAVEDHSKINEYLNEALSNLDAVSVHPNKMIVFKLISADQQIVSGIKYRIKASIVLSDCNQNDVKERSVCSPLQGAQSKICDFTIWDRPWLPNGRESNVTCEEPSKTYAYKSRGMRAAPGEDYRKFLENGLRYLDSKSQEPYKLKILEFFDGTRTTLQRHTESMFMTVKIVLSDCKKSDTKPRHKCGVLEGARPYVCKFDVINLDYLSSGLSTEIKCVNPNQHHAFRSKRHSEEKLEKHLPAFHRFINKHNRVYLNKAEFTYRFKVFRNNLKTINLMNQYEQGTATYGITKFADLTAKEFSAMHGLRTDLRNENEMPLPNAEIPDIELPNEFDWRNSSVVSKVKDQGQCGSCWAFSVTGNIEGQYAIKNGKLLEFSEQELVDCDSEDQGCNGGLMDTAYRVIEKLGGLETEGDYPYDAETEKCHFNQSLARVQLSGAVNISQNEEDMAKWLVQNGPISIAINANAMQFYVGGVSHPFKFLCNPKNLDHGVLVVGYGVHTYPKFKKSLPYWIVKNSWGRSWGEQGYYRVYRGDGTCGVNQTPSSAIVV